jgi:hypothetical protein
MPGFQALLIYQSNKLWEEGLSMVTITNTTGTQEHVWTAWRRTHEVRLRERYHAILLLMDGKSCPEAAQWRYRDEETLRTWGHACHEAGLPSWERAPIPGRPR